MTTDFNNAPGQRSFELIPNNTIAVVQINIRPGGEGDDGLLKRAQNGLCRMLDIELIVAEGLYEKRKLWTPLVVETLEGATDGHAKAVDISMGRLRAILESVRNVKPQDVSEAAKKARIATFDDFDSMRFLAKIGIEPGKDGYKDKNVILEVITPDMKDWRPVTQVTPAEAAATNMAADRADGQTAPIAIPEWAR
jgi:hypothetical protein